MADEGTATPDAGQQGTPAAQSTGGDNGYPANTPVEQMNAEQQAAYWKHYARQHEARVKQFGKLTPDELATLREKAERHDALENELASEADKRANAARAEALNEAASQYLPKLARAHLEGAASGRVDGETLSKALEFVDMAKFINDGDVDTDKVRAFVDSIAPATGTPQHQQRTGPSSAGQGNRAPATARPGEAGRLAAQQRGFIKTA